MENPTKMDDLGGKPTIFGNIHIDPPENEHGTWKSPLWKGKIIFQTFFLASHGSFSGVY